MAAAPTHHDLAQLVVPGADVLHQHLEGGELELGGQRVELLLLHLLELHAMAKLPHELHPEPGLRPKEGRVALSHSRAPQARVLGALGWGSHILPSPCAPGCQAPPAAAPPAARPPEASAASVGAGREGGGWQLGAQAPAEPFGWAWPHHTGCYSTSETRASAWGLRTTSGEAEPLAREPHGTRDVPSLPPAASAGQAQLPQNLLSPDPHPQRGTGPCSPAPVKCCPSDLSSQSPSGTPLLASSPGPHTPTLSGYPRPLLHSQTQSEFYTYLLNCCLYCRHHETRPRVLWFLLVWVSLSPSTG